MLPHLIIFRLGHAKLAQFARGISLYACLCQIAMFMGAVKCSFEFGLPYCVFGLLSCLDLFV